MEPPAGYENAGQRGLAADLDDPAYYLRDFDCVADGVRRLYAALLTPEEQEYLARVKRLSMPARQLHARLVNRKGPYFRRARLCYPEIGALDAPLAELAAEGLAVRCAVLPEAELRERLLACFTLPELRAELSPRAAPRTRAALLGWLAAWEGFDAWMAEVLARHEVVGLAADDPWAFLRFLFFGEPRDNLSDFVTRALGHVVTESFAPEHLRPHFATRAAAEDAWHMARLYRRFSEIRDLWPAAEVLAWWHSQRIGRDRLAGGHDWFDRLVDRLGRRLERQKAADAAMALYATSPAAPARERRARLLIKSGQREAASALLREMAAAPCSNEESYAARQLLARLANEARHSEGRQLQRESRSLTLPYAPRSGFGGGSVEAAVLAHYRAQGWQGVHSENWLWNASFGLLLWDIIYDPSLGVFHSPLQFAPSDLYGPEFYGRRNTRIEARLDMLRRPAEALAVISKNLAAKQGIANPFVAWHDGLREILAIMLARVPGDAHAAVLRQMARNPRHHARGFVDLFIWNDRDYRFIEIKSENDKLAPHQFEWLRFFAKAGINVSLENVRRAGV